LLTELPGGNHGNWSGSVDRYRRGASR
jgi:hypothetical protein